ncbi:MAG: hypothetical protein JWO56_388, partial [Acidobacteria bacterium]|nr:hypothetical protein [Acidobacteriota bacterium]
MSDDQPVLGPGNTEYLIRRIPDLQTVSKDAQIRYVCEWKAGGSAPLGMDETGHVGPRDGIRWYLYSAAASWLGENFKAGPLENAWSFTWDKPPGQYCVIAEIRAPGEPTTYCYRPQTVGDAGAILRAPLDQLIKKGGGPSPDDAQREIDRFRKLLDEDAQRMPPADPAKHKESVDRWKEISDRLKGLLAPSAGKRRFRMRAIHLDAATQTERVLMLFLTELGTEELHGRFGSRTNHRWALVDWTDTGNPRYRGSHEGQGSNVLEAVNACFSAWDLDNRYPEGHVTYEIPPDLYPLVGGDARRQMDTTGKNVTDRIISVLGWIAIGGLAVAGFCFIFVAVPAAMDLALGASMLASTGASAISIGQRWRDGIFDWKADAIDGLTIAAGLIGAGAWARGALVKTVTSSGKTVEGVFIGARVGTDAVQGILVGGTGFEQLDAIKNDKSLTPEERSHQILLLIAQLAAVGVLTVISLKASGKVADNLDQKPNHLPNDPRASVPEEKLTQIVDPNGPPMEIKEPPIAEGHTSEGEQHTTAKTGIEKPQTHLLPEETSFAKAYPKDETKWKYRELTKYKIQLFDHEDFGIMAEVNPDTLDLSIVIETTKGSKAAGTFKGSKELWAKDLYPKMYEHFKQQGVTVKSVSGAFMWDNVRDTSIPLYDRRMAEATAKNPNLSGAELESTKFSAAVEAVKVAKTYHYHAEEGISKVVKAKR